MKVPCGYGGEAASRIAALPTIRIITIMTIIIFSSSGITFNFLATVIMTMATATATTSTTGDVVSAASTTRPTRAWDFV